MVKILLTSFMFLLFQGDLPYWSDKKGRTPTAICNQYELVRTNTDISISTSFNYVDCFGVSRTVEVNPPEFGSQMVVYICSSVTPTLDQFPGAPIPPQATATLQGVCGGPPAPEKPPVDPGTPGVGCNTSFSYGGGNSYPSEHLIDLGTASGTVTVKYRAGAVPDKFTVINPNAAPPLNPVLVSSGYRGAYSFQSDLCNFYGRIGFGCPTCLSPLISNDLSCEIKGEDSTMTFYKSSAIRWVKILVYSPLSTRWAVDRVSCPE